MQDIPDADGATVNLFKRSQAATVAGYVQRGYSDIYSLGWLIVDVAQYVYKNGAIPPLDLPSNSIRNRDEIGKFKKQGIEISNYRCEHEEGKLITLDDLVFVTMAQYDSDGFIKYCGLIYKMLNEITDFVFTVQPY